MSFRDDQIALLSAELAEEMIHTRRKQGIELRYIEGHAAIEAANRIFGYAEWSYRMTGLRYEQGVWVATVAVTVEHAGGTPVEREDVGVGIAAVPRDEASAGVIASPDATETAIKGAVTDALKRALRTFGNAFGNSLYEKPDAQSGARPPATRQSGATSQTADTEDVRPCPTCDQPMVLRSGTTRDGRPYTAYFCSAKCGQKPIWLSDRKAS